MNIEYNEISRVSRDEVLVPGTDMAPLPLALVSSNPRKSDQLQKYAGAGERATTKPPLFDEEFIKEQLSVTPEQGMNYVANISRNKLLMQRERSRTQEGTDSDYAMIVSDSVVMLPMPNGEYHAVNRDGLTEDQKNKIREQINDQGEITYVGAVTFGRKMGESAFTVLTYLRVPLAEPLKEFPLSVDALPHIVDASRGFEAGFISHEFNEEDKVLRPAFRPTRFGVADFESVRPHISGLVPQVVELADKTLQFDQSIAPLLEQEISEHPFNTLSFYKEREKNAHADLHTFYEQLVSENRKFFATYGGNCSLYTLDSISELQEQGYDPRVVIYPSNTVGYLKAHSGIVVDVDAVRYLIDPGLTIPYPIPVSSQIPLYPFLRGSKHILTQVRDVNGDLIPDLLISHKDQTYILVGQEIETPEAFRKELPEILSTLHELRTFFKIDIHDGRGMKKLGITINVKTSSITINEREHLTVLSFSDISDESLAFIQRIFSDNGGQFNLSDHILRVIRNNQELQIQ